MNRYGLLLIAFTFLFSCNESESTEENKKEEVPHYSGIGYVDGLKQLGSSVLFTVEVPQTGDYLLKIRYKTVGESDNTASLVVNGVLTEYTLLPITQTNPDNWQNAETEVFLQNGINSIVVQNSTTMGALSELDFIEIEKK